jgi:hypothetical protein
VPTCDLERPAGFPRREHQDIGEHGWSRQHRSPYRRTCLIGPSIRNPGAARNDATPFRNDPTQRFSGPTGTSTASCRLLTPFQAVCM